MCKFSLDNIFILENNCFKWMKLSTKFIKNVLNSFLNRPKSWCLEKVVFTSLQALTNEHSEIKSGWIQGRVVKDRVVAGGWPGVVEYLV